MELSKKERRELRREEHRQEVASFGRKKQIKKWSVWVAVIIFVLGGGYAAYKSFSQKIISADIGEVFPIEGANHVPDGTKVSYKTNPPASGSHYARPAEWGIYEKALPDETLVHNLEHGGVWISYRPDVPETTKEKLRAITKGYRSKIILTPRDANDSPITLVSWGRIHKMDSFSEDIINNFIVKYKNTGPELVPD